MTQPYDSLKTFKDQSKQARHARRTRLTCHFHKEIFRPANHGNNLCNPILNPELLSNLAFQENRTHHQLHDNPLLQSVIKKAFKAHVDVPCKQVSTCILTARDVSTFPRRNFQIITFRNNDR